jgi:uncharacterized protein (DUF885 family)
MDKRNLLLSVIVASLACPGPLRAQPAAAATKPAWLAQSDANARTLVEAEAAFMPEPFSMFGLAEYDERVSDLGPNRESRLRAALAAAQAGLQQKLAGERDARVKQDLEVMIAAADRLRRSSELDEKLTLPWLDVGQLVFQGVKSLLSDQIPRERQQKALARLSRYAGLAPGSRALAVQARERYDERAGNAQLLRPSRLEVEQALRNSATFSAGIRKLFEQYKIEGAEPALTAIEKQLAEHADWLKQKVLPSARKQTTLPAELYAMKLEEVGIDIDPRRLLKRAQLAFVETRAAMQMLAPRVAEARGWPMRDYRDVIRALKRETIPNARLEEAYREVILQIDPIVQRERIVSVPNRPMVMRLGTPAENAAQPAPHFLPAPLFGNQGEQGQFVLTSSNPAQPDETYDDFNYGAVRWTLSAHEGRPGHELQFTSLVEHGVSMARSLFAFNSVNIEGWALYAEAEMVPFEPLDAQLIALQFRLLRAARAMLDPMLNLNLIDRERAGKVLTDDVVLSKAMARQELDRYAFNMPGQAGSYFYGYSRLLELRAETELALGEAFDRQRFNDFILAQGMLPPSLLAKAVREQFIPAHRRKTQDRKILTSQ